MRGGDAAALPPALAAAPAAALLAQGAPENLLCPVSLALLSDPVIAADGMTYQRAALQQCIDYARQRE